MAPDRQHPNDRKRPSTRQAEPCPRANMPGADGLSRDSRTVLAALAMAGMVGMFLPVGALAESTSFVVQTTKQGYYDPQPAPVLHWNRATPQLDRSDRPAPPPVTKTFVIEETHKTYIQPPSIPQHGVVGLDMLIQRDRYPMVEGVFQGTPASKAGIHAGDTIVAVNGEQTLGKSRAEVDDMISDIPGEVVNLTIARGPQMKQVRLTVMAVGDTPAAVQPVFSMLFPGY